MTFAQRKLMHWVLYSAFLAVGVFVVLFLLQDIIATLLGWPLPGEG